MILGNRGPVTSSQGVGVTAASAAKETGVGVRKRAGYGAFRDVYRPGLVSVNLTVVCPVEGQYRSSWYVCEFSKSQNFWLTPAQRTRMENEGHSENDDSQGP